MTALNKATQIPGNINSLEKLLMWGLLLANSLNPSVKVKTDSATTEDAVLYSIFKGGDNEFYFSGRVIIQIPADYATDSTVRFWEKARDIQNINIPTGWTQNAS